MNEPRPPPRPAPSDGTANHTEGRGCGKRPQPIAGEGAVPSSRRGAMGSPRADSVELLERAADESRMEDPAAPGAGTLPANGNGNGKGKQAAPKGREAFRSQRRESEVRIPESFSWGWETPAGGKRWLRRFGPEPPARPGPPAGMGACGARRESRAFFPLAFPLGARRCSAVSSETNTSQIPVSVGAAASSEDSYLRLRRKQARRR